MAVSDGIFDLCHLSDLYHAGLSGICSLCGTVSFYRAVDVYVPAARTAAQYPVRSAEAQQ